MKPLKRYSDLFGKLSVLSHYVDETFRRYRPLLSISGHLNYKRWIANQSWNIPNDKSVVIFDFATNRIDGPQGRRFYSLFIFFVRAGYYPILKSNYLFLDNIEDKHKKYCTKEAFSLINNPSQIKVPYILITDRNNSVFSEKAYKKITIDFTPDYREGDGTFPFSFPMFSQIYADKQDLNIKSYRAEEKNWNIFFGGDARFDKYNRSSVKKIYHKIPRGQALEILRNNLAKSEIAEPADSTQLEKCRGVNFNGITIVNTTYCKIPVNEWLNVIAKTRFFLALPGVRYPMSHNAIEALAVGAIPILEYPELFYPPLEHGKNCLTYSTPQELVSVVKYAINMSQAEIAKLSRGASQYYDDHLSPETVINQLLATPSTEVRLRLLPFLRRGGGFA